MIKGVKELETKSVASEVIRHSTSTVLPISKGNTLAKMNFTDLMKALQEGMRTNKVAENVHMYPRREL